MRGRGNQSQCDPNLFSPLLPVRYSPRALMMTGLPCSHLQRSIIMSASLYTCVT